MPFSLFGLFQPAPIIDHAKSEKEKGDAYACQPGNVFGLTIGKARHCGESKPASEFDENPSWKGEGNAELGDKPKPGNQREQATNAGGQKHFALCGLRGIGKRGEGKAGQQDDGEDVNDAI